MRLREADLDGHLVNDKEKDGAKPEDKSEIKPETKIDSKPQSKTTPKKSGKESAKDGKASDDDTPVPPRIEYGSKTDYQFMQAVNLLKGLNILQAKP